MLSICHIKSCAKITLGLNYFYPENTLMWSLFSNLAYNVLNPEKKLFIGSVLIVRIGNATFSTPVRKLRRIEIYEMENYLHFIKGI